jgi:hypothetical protein
MSGDVRARLEARQMAERYQQQAAPRLCEQAEQAAEQAEDERRLRLAKNADKIRQDQIANMLLDMTEDERAVVNTILYRDNPENAGNAEVVWATLEQIRTDGMANFHRIMVGATKAEKEKVWEILYATGDARARVGLNPEACEDALRRVRRENFMNEEEN